MKATIVEFNKLKFTNKTLGEITIILKGYPILEAQVIAAINSLEHLHKKTVCKALRVSDDCSNSLLPKADGQIKQKRNSLNKLPCDWRRAILESVD